jgi:transcriptional regulator with XRE-family HTH domain
MSDESIGPGGVFAEVLRKARESYSQGRGKGLSQAQLAKMMNLSRPVVGGWESARASPSPGQAVKLAKLLGADQEEFILLSILQDAKCRNECFEDVNASVSRLRTRLNGHTVAPTNCQPLATHLSLRDSFAAFSPLKIIVGDKREQSPANAGDLYVNSASTVDDRWVCSLGLRRDTEKISDKVLMTADDQWLKEKLGKCHLLCIGSPASNLFSRRYNNEFLFRFAITREAEKKWEWKLKDMRCARTPADLLKFYYENKDDLKQTMRLFKPAGFIDFNYRHMKLGMDVAHNKDFAVISIGRNPFAEPEAPFFSILVAGVHHPGTANALRFLSDPSNFEHHPFGGILEVDVPSKSYTPEEVKWHDRIEQCFTAWHGAGPDERALEYTPDMLRGKLEDLRGELTRLVLDVEITPAEIENHVRLIDALKSVRGSI